MKKLFTYEFNAEKGFNPEAYLEKMMDAAQDGKLYIARAIDEDGAYYEVAETEEAANGVSVVTFDWRRYDADMVLGQYDFLTKKIERTKGEEVYVACYCCAMLRDEEVINRINRLRALRKLDAPKAVTEKEKHSLFEEMIFECFGGTYQDVIFVRGENAPEKGSRADLANKKVIEQFMGVYERVLAYLKEKIECSVMDIQKEFQLGYSFARYLVEQLENNDCVWECCGDVVFMQNQKQIKINATPYGKDSKFLDEMTEEELLRAINEMEKGEENDGCGVS